MGYNQPVPIQNVTVKLQFYDSKLNSDLTKIITGRINGKFQGQLGKIGKKIDFDCAEKKFYKNSDHVSIGKFSIKKP